MTRAGGGPSIRPFRGERPDSIVVLTMACGLGTGYAHPVRAELTRAEAERLRDELISALAPELIRND